MWLSWEKLVCIFDGWCLSPFSKTTSACFQSWGISPWSMESWKSRAKAGASSSAAVLKMYAVISSGPDAFQVPQQFMDTFPVYLDALPCWDAGRIFPRNAHSKCWLWLWCHFGEIHPYFLVVLLWWILVPCSLYRLRTSLSCLCSLCSLCLPYMIYLLSWSCSGLSSGGICTKG